MLLQITLKGRLKIQKINQELKVSRACNVDSSNYLEIILERRNALECEKEEVAMKEHALSDNNEKIDEDFYLDLDFVDEDEHNEEYSNNNSADADAKKEMGKLLGVKEEKLHEMKEYCKRIRYQHELILQCLKQIESIEGKL